MNSVTVKMTDEELQSAKLKEITSVVSSKFTDEEKEQLKATTASAERRALVIELYKKYIDEVILEENQDAADEAAKEVKVDEAKADEAEVAAKIDEEEKETVKVSAPTTSETVNVNISFTVDIRGVTGHNGTFTYTCDKLLLIAFRNPKCSITFRNAQRANQFINIVNGVSHVKGISTITDEARKTVVARIKTVNNL